MLRMRFDLMGLGMALAFGMVKADVHAQANAELSVCTFNVRYDNPNDTIKWHERRNEVASAIRYFDIAGVQEALRNQYDDLKSLFRSTRRLVPGGMPMETGRRVRFGMRSGLISCVERPVGCR